MVLKVTSDADHHSSGQTDFDRSGEHVIETGQADGLRSGGLVRVKFD
jgi:hypothetical protein